MPKIKVSADSTCDLSPELIRQHDIAITPLSIVYGDVSLKDGVEITPLEVYKLVDEQDILCSTAAVNYFEYKEFFQKRLQDCDEIIHSCISADMSACYQNACKAAEEFAGRVHIIDSRNLSTGIGHVVMRAALLAEQGKLTGAEIAANCRELTSRIDVSFVIDTMEYLKRGGRCSALKAFGATVLRLKPCIEVKDGKMTVQGTYKGSLEKSLKRYVNDRLEGVSVEHDRIFITHSGCSQDIVNMVRSEISKYAEFTDTIETRASCTVSCHCGPNTLGILFIRSK